MKQVNKKMMWEERVPTINGLLLKDIEHYKEIYERILVDYQGERMGQPIELTGNWWGGWQSDDKFIEILERLRNMDKK